MTDTALIWGTFARLLAIVYAIAFLVLRAEIIPLVGRRGITPAAARLRHIRGEMGLWRAVARHPSLLWISASDDVLRWLPIAGAAAALSAAAGVASVAMFAAAWLLYLSLDVALALSFPWESLLLEAGVLAIFLPALSPLPSMTMTRAPGTLLMFAFEWLLFRVLFGFGKTKFTREAASEPDYLRRFLISQPIPSPLGWLAHRLPLPILVWSHALLFVTEIVLPFAIFFPGWPRLGAALAFTTLMVSIQAMGNFGFFNILVITLCVPLLDQRAITAFSLAELGSAHGVAVAAVFAWTLVAGLCHLPFNTWVARSWTEWPAWGALRRFPRAVVAVLRAAMPFRTVHAYGVFPPRIGPAMKLLPVYEGSMDGMHWEPFLYRFMPSTPASPPRFVAPHTPRLDHWVIYEAFAVSADNYLLTVFASSTPFAFSNVRTADRVMQRLMEPDSPVRSLFAAVPFGGAPPRLMRVRRYAFTPTTTAERRATGHSWHRELVDQDGGERPSDPVLFQRWLPGSEQLHPDDRWARRRVPRLAPLLSARSLGEVRAVLDAPAAAMWDTFWDDLMPALRGAADAGWPAVVDLAWRLRERFDPLALHALDRIRGAVTTALLERLEPHLFGHAAPPLTLATYFDASLAAHAVALDGTGAADVALADSAALVARAAAGIEDRGLMMLAAFRLETLATHARGERLNRRFMPPTPAAPPIVPGFARLLPRLAEVRPDEQVTLRR